MYVGVGNVLKEGWGMGTNEARVLSVSTSPLPPMSPNISTNATIVVLKYIFLYNSLHPSTTYRFYKSVCDEVDEPSCVIHGGHVSKGYPD